jgi:hypothetical protein
MGKVLLTKKEAYALSVALEDRYQDEVVKIHVDVLNSKNKWVGRAEPLNELGLDDLIKALYNGYEIQKEPTHIDLPSVRIWKADYNRKGEIVERYNICIKELDITISLTNDKNKKTYEKVDRIVKNGSI